MKSINTILLFSSMFILFGCSDDDMDMDKLADQEGPELNARWINNPPIEGPTGPITDGSNYTISIEAGFHLYLDFKDDSNIESGVAYFLVNDDSTLRENIIYEGTVFGYKEGQHGYVFRVSKLSLGDGNFYDLKSGDKFTFYFELSDEAGNMSNMSWTADVTE